MKRLSWSLFLGAAVLLLVPQAADAGCPSSDTDGSDGRCEIVCERSCWAWWVDCGKLRATCSGHLACMNGECGAIDGRVICRHGMHSPWSARLLCGILPPPGGGWLVLETPDAAPPQVVAQSSAAYAARVVESLAFEPALRGREGASRPLRTFFSSPDKTLPRPVVDDTRWLGEVAPANLREGYIVAVLQVDRAGAIAGTSVGHSSRGTGWTRRALAFMTDNFEVDVAGEQESSFEVIALLSVGKDSSTFFTATY